ncbi:hypothetical protein F503_00049 [Ophiostoma piceae UAMH 11346]|uniref:Uncharacterized protein n=1 Tax=Ophiostoma piceae (strain UAMH 11346) TaxID=1262450 RepID=S3CVT5_OPHP1|nr:hypothetical protein F503_00049 [Ophiostoma piceae UAMH 11346]
MSIKERLSRMVRKSNTSNTSSTSTSTTSDNERKQAPSVVGRMLTKKFSRRSKPSTSSTSSDLRSGSDTGRSDNANTARRPSPANLDGLRWEDMTDAQRVQATFNTYEIRFGASNTARVSLEGISPCTTRTRQPGPKQADYY